MRRSRNAIGLLWLALAAQACGRDSPSAPGLHTLSGRVRLVGHLVDASGFPVGTRTVSDADGVTVELLYGTQVVARTTTTDGGYSFRGLSSGGYRARTRVIGLVADQTAVLTITDTDLVSGDVLQLSSLGDILPIPNPVVTEAMLYFDLPDTEIVQVKILDIGCNTVRTLLDATRVKGLNQVRWDGLDGNGAPASAPLYWATLAAGADTRAQLLFR